MNTRQLDLAARLWAHSVIARTDFGETDDEQAVIHRASVRAEAALKRMGHAPYISLAQCIAAAKEAIPS